MVTKKMLAAAANSWEQAVGYSRAVRVGSQVIVAGTTATAADGTVQGGDDPYKQSMVVLQKIEEALERVGASMNDVVRTRMYLRNVEHWPAVARAHLEYFGAIRPAATLVEVSRLIHPDILVEIEADAITDRPWPNEP